MTATTTREPSTFDPAPLRGCQLIAIDGDNGAGKSDLAAELKDALVATVVAVDCHLAGNGAPYLEQINYSALSAELAMATRPVILEGQFMLDVLERVGTRADYLILMRKRHEGFLYHEPLDAELVAYYQRRSPANTADLCMTMVIRPPGR